MSDHKEEKPRGGLNVDIDHLSVTGHLVFAGRDGNVNVTTGGDVAQSSTLVVAGVQTTRVKYEQMMEGLQEVEKAVEEAPLEPKLKEAAKSNMQDIKAQLTGAEPPNPHLLIDAVKALFLRSKPVSKILLRVFADPLIGEIFSGLGEFAFGFYKQLMRQKR